MRKLTNALLFMILFTSLFAENKITTFNGGKHNMNLSLYNSFLAGITAKSRNYGSTVSSAVKDPALNILNPAGLAFIKKSMISFDLAPGFSINMGSFIKNNVETSVDDILKDNQADNIEKKYPDVDLFTGQSGWLNQLSVTTVTDKIGNFGFTWYRPFELSLDYTGNNLQFIVQDSVLKNPNQPSEYVETTILPLSIEIFANSKITMQTANISWGKCIKDDLSMGLGVNFNKIQIQGSLDGKIGGFIRQFGGDTDINVAFDDPNVYYRNTMNDSLNANFYNNFYGFNLATTWIPSEKYILDMVFNMPRSSKLKGDLYLVQHTLGALNMGYDKDGPDNIPNNSDDEEMFDVEKLKPSQIAYTNRTIYTSQDMSINLPGDISLAFTYLKNDFKFIFSYEKSFGELSLDYSCVRYRDGLFKDSTNTFIPYADTTNLSYTVGFKPNHTIKMAFGWKKYVFSTQFFIGDLISEGMKDSDGKPVKPAKNLIIPSLAFGASYNLYKDVTADVNLVAIPNPLFRTTVTWKF